MLSSIHVVLIFLALSVLGTPVWQPREDRRSARFPHSGRSEKRGLEGDGPTTNGARLAAGWPLLPPAKARSGLAPRTSPPVGGVCPGGGNIYVKVISGGNFVGYLSRLVPSSQSLVVTNTPSDYLIVQTALTSTSRDIVLVNDNSPYPLLGLATSQDASTNPSFYAFLGATNPTLAGQGPAQVGNSVSTVPSESAIWQINNDGSLAATWVNSDLSPVALVPAYFSIFNEVLFETTNPAAPYFGPPTSLVLDC